MLYSLLDLLYLPDDDMQRTALVGELPTLAGDRTAGLLPYVRQRGIVRISTNREQDGTVGIAYFNAPALCCGPGDLRRDLSRRGGRRRYILQDTSQGPAHSRIGLDRDELGQNTGRGLGRDRAPGVDQGSVAMTGKAFSTTSPQI
jgi:hypothetical protein